MIPQGTETYIENLWRSFSVRIGIIGDISEDLLPIIDDLIEWRISFFVFCIYGYLFTSSRRKSSPEIMPWDWTEKKPLSDHLSLIYI